MKRTKDILIATFAVLLLAALAYVWFSPSGLQRLPEVSLPTLDGQTLALQDLRGRPVLVNFWATTCPGCVKEMPHLAELYEELHPQGLEIVGIAMYYDPPSQVLELAQRRNIPYPIALDLQGEAARAFGDVKLTPTSFLIDPNGRIVSHKIGELDMEAVRQQILAMLPSRPAAEAGAG